MPQIRNSADSLTHLLTRVKSRDASASKKKRKIGWFSAMLCRLFSYIRYGHVFDVED